MRWLALVFAALALTLVGTGCGGGDDESSGDSDSTVLTDTTETEDTTTTDETTGEETTDDGDLSGVLADEDCRALVAAGASFAQAFAGASGTSDETDAFEELADKVPDEIKADVQVLAEAYASYAAELQDIGIEAGQTPNAAQIQQLQAALASFDQQAVSGASERLSAWADTNCPSG